MSVNPFLGVGLHSVGGLAAGSFYVPFRKVRRWAWESYWLIQGVFAWLLMPWVAAFLTSPHLLNTLSKSPLSSMIWSYFYGALWGIGGLTFGLTMRYLGMSLGYAIALGFCAAFGTLIPPIFEGKLLEMTTAWSGRTVLAGVLMCLAGIGLAGYAGIRKEKELTEAQKKDTIREFALTKGFAVGIFAGIMSACMAFGLRAGKPIADMALTQGTPDIFQNNPVFIFVMAGGFTTNLIWCVILNARNRSGGDYVKRMGSQLLKNYVFSGLAGVIWFGQFFFYGMGTTRMGKYDFSSWTIHMAFIIVFSSFWGLHFGEWRGVSRKTMGWVWLGIFILTSSTLVIGIGNRLVSQG